jgi:hypothetical protein
MKSSKKELTLLLLALLTTITTVAVTFATISPDNSSIIGIQSVFAQDDDDQGEDDDDQGEDDDDQGEDDDDQGVCKLVPCKFLEP